LNKDDETGSGDRFVKLVYIWPVPSKLNRASLDGSAPERRTAKIALCLLPLVLLAPTVLRAEPSATKICLLGQIAEESVIEDLNRAFNSSGLTLELERSCSRDPGAFRARMVARDSTIYVVLRTPAGKELDRRIPWLVATEGALPTTARLGRLHQLSVLVEALVAEHCVAMSSRAVRSDGLAHGSERLAKPRASAVAEERLPVFEQPEASAPQPARDASIPTANQNDAESLADGSARRPVPLPAVSATVRSESPAMESGLRWRFKAESSFSEWIRAAGTHRPGLLAALSWGPIVAQFGYQPKMTFGPVDTDTFGGSVGAGYTVVNARWLVLDLRAALDVERQNISFTASSAPGQGRPGGPTGPRPPGSHSVIGPSLVDPGPGAGLDHLWLVGPASSLRLAVPVVAGMRVGLSVDARWMFSTLRTLPRPDDPMWNKGFDLGLGVFAGYAI
jgi:hypothetical protein